MESLIKSAGDQNFSALITVVISDNELAPGIDLAKNYNVPVEIFDKKKFDKSQFESNAQRVLLNYKIRNNMFGRIYANIIQKLYK